MHLRSRRDESSGGTGAALRPLLRLLVASAAISVADGVSACEQLNNCNGHGTCTSLTKVCDCFEGWGAATDKPAVPMSKGDCSERMCKAGKAWNDIPTGTNTAHAEVECSGVGLCARASGICTCFKGYEGDHCHRSTCGESGCGKNGRCVTLREASMSFEAQPVGLAISGGYGGSDATNTWDSEMIKMCLCDSSWEVGLESGQTQLAEYYSPDCTKRHCPSGDDPMTVADETDCSGKLQDPYTFKTTLSGVGGASGNKCQYDCSGRGKCDHSTGVCACYTGWSGGNCGTQNTRAVYSP